VPGGAIEGWPFHRWLLSWAANIYCRILLWLPTRDTTSGYRCYTRDLLQHIGLDELSQGEGSVMVKDETICIRCGLCAERCPAHTITMEAFEAFDDSPEVVSAEALYP